MSIVERDYSTHTTPRHLLEETMQGAAAGKNLQIWSTDVPVVLLWGISLLLL
jgi:hypothetical protein